MFSLKVAERSTILCVCSWIQKSPFSPHSQGRVISQCVLVMSCILADGGSAPSPYPQNYWFSHHQFPDWRQFSSPPGWATGPGEGSEEICQNIKDNTLIFRPGKVLIWIFNSTLNVKLLFSILILHPIYVKLQPTHILTAVLTLSYFHLLLC